MAFCKPGLSKDPEPLVVHVDVLAEPPIDPFKTIISSEQIDASAPADT